jgi:hypothetical protein
MHGTIVSESFSADFSEVKNSRVKIFGVTRGLYIYTWVYLYLVLR